MANELEVAWMAGLFEGEGCMWKDRRWNTCYLRLVMTDRDVVERFHSLAGCGTLREWKKQSFHHTQAYCWQTGNSPDVKRLLLMLLPYFGERRRDKAVALLEVLRSNKNRSLI